LIDRLRSLHRQLPVALQQGVSVKLDEE